MSDVYNDAGPIVDDDAGNRIAGGLAKTTLEYLARAVVDDPDSVVVDLTESSDKITLIVHVATDDKGKIIGKRGRIANAVRTVVRAVGAREGLNVTVDIADD